MPEKVWINLIYKNQLCLVIVIRSRILYKTTVNIINAFLFW